MPATAASRLTPYVQELLDNEYAQENLLDGAAKLRAAYERSTKRRVKAARDRKLRRQLTVAALSIGEGARALAGERRKPPKHLRRELRMKIVFTPVSLLAGLLAGLVGKKIFERLWGLVDEEEPPRPEHREFSWPKLIAALLFEGAIFRLAKGLTDHGLRRSFAKATGSWPGEEEPQPK